MLDLVNKNAKMRKIGVNPRHFVLYVALRVISVIFLKYFRRIFYFGLTEKQPAFRGFKISEQSRELASRVCLLLQGPICRMNPDLTLAYAQNVKSELGFGLVVYCGPDYKEMEGKCDVSIPATMVDGDFRNQINLQKASTLTGLRFAGSHEYTLKMRADSIVTRRDAVVTLLRLLRDSRFVVVSHQKPFYYPFLSDHIQFGRTEDLIGLWNFKWDGTLSIELLKDRPTVTEDSAPSPEWVLGWSFKIRYGNDSISICSDRDIGYMFLKYDFYDVERFDWESCPHFGQVSVYPGPESCVSTVEMENVRGFCMPVYENKICLQEVPDCCSVDSKSI